MVTGGGLFNSGYTNYTTPGGVNSGVLQYLYYVVILLLVGIVILVILHFSGITIFKTEPGKKGLLSLPGSDDSKLFWKKGLSIVDLSGSNITSAKNYSFTFDFILDDPTRTIAMPKVLFSRGNSPAVYPETYPDTALITSIIPTFNVCVYMEKTTNNLVVAVQTVKTTASGTTYPITSVVIPNIPIRKQISLGVMVGDKALEVYVNGYLAKTKNYLYPIREEIGDFRGPTDLIQQSVRVQDLRLWNRPLSPSEFRSYVSTGTQFELKEIPDTCLTTGNTA
jgi:hypothetical protein